MIFLCLGRDLNAGPLEFEGIVITRLQQSMKYKFYINFLFHF
jgi:hypothetical protein